mmetsp:Transcript_115328/g.200099  ORF Transcript_115328/g.200099 Transcript_115328/m.200099 type:complete len:235 (+) Transcript_115328:1196-1900(+)
MFQFCWHEATLINMLLFLYAPFQAHSQANHRFIQLPHLMVPGILGRCRVSSINCIGLESMPRHGGHLLLQRCYLLLHLHRGTHCLALGNDNHVVSQSLLKPLKLAKNQKDILSLWRVQKLENRLQELIQLKLTVILTFIVVSRSPRLQNFQRALKDVVLNSSFCKLCRDLWIFHLLMRDVATSIDIQACKEVNHLVTHDLFSLTFICLSHDLADNPDEHVQHGESCNQNEEDEQ